MRQQILMAQLDDMHQLLKEAIDELETLSDHVPHDSKEMLDTEAAIKRLRDRADEVMSR